MSANSARDGARLRAERKKRGLVVADLARLFREVAPERVSARLPSLRTMERIIRSHEADEHSVGPRYRLLYAAALEIAEDELFASESEKLDKADTGSVFEEVEPTKRRDVLKLGVAAVTPEVAYRLLRDAAEEAMEFTRLTGITSLGAGTFAHLEAVVIELDRSYNRQPPAELFSMAHAYRHRVSRMIEGPHTLKQARELYVYAAWLSEALAWLAHDLGDPLGAEAWAVDAFEHADQAGHDELCAWACDVLASIAIYAEQPARALTAAERGIVRAPRTHPLAVRLRAQAARAHARLGDREECEKSIRQAGDLYNRLPGRAPLRLAMDTGSFASFTMTSYPAQAYIWLGDTEQGDFEKAKGYAQSAIAVPSTVPGRTAIARVDLGIALAQLGEPEEAAALGRQALAAPRLFNSLQVRAADLNKVLAARYPELPAVREYEEVVRQIPSGAGQR